MSKEEFTSLSIEKIRQMSAYDIWDFIADYFKSINDHSEDEHLKFIKNSNLDRIKDQEKAWRYMVGVYRTYADWE